MSANYASGLSACDSKGVCGIPEVHDTPEEAANKIRTLSQWIRESRHCVLLIGAGISTAAGIPDFRGPKGIWTIEKLEKELLQKQLKTTKNRRNEFQAKKLKATDETKTSMADNNHCNFSSKTEVGKKDIRHEVTDEQLRPEQAKTNIKIEDKDTESKAENKESKSVSLAEARPTLTHLTIKSLVENNFVNFVISQNVDGLFLKTGIRRKYISEVHGNFYLDECTVCLKRFVRNSPSPTMALKVSDTPCPSKNRKTRPCQGYLRDTILDWEDTLPDRELNAADKNCGLADLIICLGTTLQINPIGQMPFHHKKRRKPDNPLKVVIVNLQPTSKDKWADLVIHDFVDDVCRTLLGHLNLQTGLEEDLTNFPNNEVKPWE